MPEEEREAIDDANGRRRQIVGGTTKDVDDMSA